MSKPTRRTSAGIQEAVDAASASGGDRVVDLDTGWYTLTETIHVRTHGVRIRGAGGYSTMLKRKGDYGDTIHFEFPDENPLYGCGIEGVHIISDDHMVQGAHLNLVDCSMFHLSDVRLADGYVGLMIEGGSRIFCRELQINAGPPRFSDLYKGRSYMSIVPHEYASGKRTKTPSAVYLSDSTFRSSGQGHEGFVEYGLETRCADGLFISNTHIGNGAIANWLIKPMGGDVYHKICGIFASNLWLDEVENYGLLVEQPETTGCTLFGQIQVENFSIGISDHNDLANNGVLINANMLNILRLSGGHITNMGLEGIDILNGRRITVSDVDITSCDLTKTGHACIHVGADPRLVALKNNRLGWRYFPVSSEPADTGYGIFIEYGEPGRVIYTGNDCSGNQDGWWYDGQDDGEEPSEPTPREIRIRGDFEIEEM